MKTILTTAAVISLLVLSGCALTQTNTNTSTNPTSTGTVKTNTESVTTNTNSVVTNDNENENANVNENSNTNETVITTVGVTWLTQPEEINSRGLFQNEEFGFAYYIIANLADGGEVLLVQEQTMGTAVSRFRKDASGKYYLLANHSDSYYVENPSDVFTAEVSIDTTTRYSELESPNELTLASLTLSQQALPFENQQFVEDITPPESGEFAEYEPTPYGTVHKYSKTIRVNDADTTIQAKKYYLEVADSSTEAYLTTKDFLADDNTVIGSFTTVDSEKFTARSFFRGVVADGCGLTGGDQYVGSFNESELVQIGSTPNTEPLYTLATDATDNTVLQAAYDTYTIGRNYDGSTETVLTYEDFVAAQPLLIWQDGEGDYLLFLDNNFSPLVECGKPVVYLYPTQPTQVSVQVGAAITVSEPTYGNGWKVLAQPTGELTTSDGQVYSSLYWEGLGQGEYPEITTGKVVAHDLVEQVMRDDMRLLGLNQTETDDFLEFWLPRMPQTAYVRLSWLTTEQMNQLAPLRISPRPDSVIRVFLDFAGQDTIHTTLRPQRLPHVQRHGFSVVEWGGLLL